MLSHDPLPIAFSIVGSINSRFSGNELIKRTQALLQVVKIKYNLSRVSKTEPSSRTKLLSCVRCVTSWPRINCQSLIHFICDMMSSFLFLNIHLHECDELFNIIFFPSPPMEKSGRKVPFLERFPMRIYFIETKSEKQNRQTGT